MTQFRELFRNVRVRRRAFVFDDRYLTVVAFIEGCDHATGSELLEGFNAWVARRVGTGESWLHWSTQLAHKHGAPASVTEVPDELRESVIADLFAMLDDFLADRESTRNDQATPI